MNIEMANIGDKAIWRKGVEHGEELERKRITAMAENLICFDHKQTGTCEHSACYSLELLIEGVNGK